MAESLSGSPIFREGEAPAEPGTRENTLSQQLGSPSRRELVEPIEQTIEGGLPFLLGVVGSRRDLLADPFDQFRSDGLCVWARFFAFFARFG